MIREEVRLGHLVRFPQELDLAKKIVPDFEITWASRITKFNTEISIYFIKPLTHISQAFGFNQELMIGVTEFRTLEARCIQAIEQMFQQLPAKGRVDQTVAILFSKDRKAEKWIQEYIARNPQARAYVGISIDDLIESKESWYLRNRLISQLFSRDMFDYTLPLDSDLFFFGRQQIVAEHIDAIGRSENRGLFGLRKTGKTSVLFKIRRVCIENSIPVRYYDCKVSSIYRLSGDDLLDKIIEDTEESLNIKVKGWRGKKDATERFMSFISKLNGDSRICFIFDEIEYISTDNKLAPHWANDFIPFWQALWSAQSQFRRFSFIIAGVNASIVERDKVHGVQNPMFGIVKGRYLTGFDRAEMQSLLHVLGRRMGLLFHSSAVDALYKRYGGHPLLTRMICSQLNNGYKAKQVERPIEITARDISVDLLSREEEIQFYCNHITSELEEFYPDEFEMLELLAIENVVDFNELANDVDLIRHLRSYGLVDLTNPHQPVFKIPVIKSYVANKWRKKNSGILSKYIVPDHRRQEFVSGRCGSILREMRMAERKFSTLNLPPLYNGSGPSEAEMFAASSPAMSKENLIFFLNQSNRSIIEPIDREGRRVSKKNYFFGDIYQAYVKLWPALNRIRAYRNKFLHLELNPQAEENYKHYLGIDLEGRDQNTVLDGWFQLQSAILNQLLICLQAEMAVYD